MRASFILCSWLVASSGIACSTNVRLGDVPPDVGLADAAVDASTEDATLPDADTKGDASVPDRGVFDGGDQSYNLSFSEPPSVVCFDDLEGKEDSFRTLTLSTERLVNGIAEFRRTDTFAYMLAGPAITQSFGLHSLSLYPDSGPDAEPGVYISDSISFSGAGPETTQRVPGGVWLELGVSKSATGAVTGGVGIGFEHPSQAGFCGVAFGVVLTPR